MALTRRQAEILEYVRDYSEARGYAPTLLEIAGRFSLTSVATVHKHITLLAAQGYLRRVRNARRGIAIVARERGGGWRVPLLGAVAAGHPIEPVTTPEEIVVPETWVARGRTYALRVHGDSMIDEQIRDGDIVIVEEREAARNGETVIALVDGEGVTVKRYFRDGGRVRLLPANPTVVALDLSADRVRVQGVVVGVLRRL